MLYFVGSRLFEDDLLGADGKGGGLGGDDRFGGDGDFGDDDRLGDVDEILFFHNSPTFLIKS
jgi:hypothetical protein